MLETKDVYLFFYNAFGMAIISKDTVTVSVNGYNSNDSSHVRGRRLEKELEDEIKLLDRPMAIPFAAWVDDSGVRLTVGKLDDYDKEIYEANKEVIDELIKSALAMFKGHLMTDRV